MNDSEEEPGEYKCLHTADIKKSLVILGIMANGICIVIFSLIVKQAQGNMFRYLLIKSIMDCFISLLSISDNFDVCNNFKHLICVLNSIITTEYLLRICLICSIVFEISATFDCYISISRKLKNFQNNLFFYSFSISLIILIVLIYLMFPLMYNIEKYSFSDSNNISYSGYYISSNSFGMFSERIHGLFYELLTRDVVLLIILITLNMLILFTLIKTTVRRRALAGNNTNNNMVISSQNAERKKMIMILLTGLNYFIGHFPSFLYFFLKFYFQIYLTLCYFIYFEMLLYLSYVNGIFFYFFFNNVFRKTLIRFIPFINRNNR
jgi:hypothetical protein